MFFLFAHCINVFDAQVPDCKVIRFNIEYTIHWFEEDMIEVAVVILVGVVVVVIVVVVVVVVIVIVL